MSRAYSLLYSTRHIAGIPALLDRVVALEEDAPADPVLAGELDFFRGIPVFYSGDLEAAKRLFRAALRKLPEVNVAGRALSDMYAYVILYLEGQGDLAVEGLRAAIQRNQPRSLHYLGRLVFGRSYIYALAGRWPESFRAAEELVVDFSQPNDLSFAVAWGVYMEGIASLQMLDLEEADRCFAQAFELRYITNAQAAIDGLIGHALCRQLQGKAKEADECLHEAREFAHWIGDPAKIDVVDSVRARIALLRGDEDAAARWLAACHWKPDVPVKMFFLEWPEITACRVLVAKGAPECLDQATALLGSMEEESRRFHPHLNRIYGKLGVTSRREAARKAKRLGLV